MTSIGVRILTLAAATALTATGLFAPAGAGPAPPPQAQGSQACNRADLDVRAGKVEGAAGSTFRRINFVNTGPSACTIQGWPRIVFRNADGHRIGKPARRTRSRPADLVSIPAGGKARSTVRVPNPGSFSPADCRPRQAEEIRVTPPHRSFSVRLAWSIDVCSKPAGRTSVDAIHRGR